MAEKQLWSVGDTVEIALEHHPRIGAWGRITKLHTNGLGAYVIMEDRESDGEQYWGFHALIRVASAEVNAANSEKAKASELKREIKSARRRVEETRRDHEAAVRYLTRMEISLELAEKRKS